MRILLLRKIIYSLVIVDNRYILNLLINLTNKTCNLQPINRREQTICSNSNTKFVLNWHK